MIKQPKDQIDIIIKEELNRILLDEGMVDAMKSAWAKTKGAASGAWEAVKGRMAQATGAFKGAIQKADSVVRGAYPALQAQYQQVQAAASAAGEAIQPDDAMKNLQQLSSQAQAVSQGLEAEAKSVQAMAAQSAKAAAPQQAQQQQQQVAGQQESFARHFEASLFEGLKAMDDSRESIMIKESSEHAERLDELGGVGIAGLSLGGFGAVKLTLHGLNKLFGKFGNKPAQTIAAGFHTAYDTIHHVEVATLDFVFPDKVAYAFYKPFASKLGKGKPVLSFEEFAAPENAKTKQKVKKYMYTVVLLSLFAAGVTHLMHASYNFLFAAETGANTVKAIEIGEALIEIGTTAMESGGAGAAIQIADMADIVGDAVDSIPDMTADATLEQ